MFSLTGSRWSLALTSPAVPCARSYWTDAAATVVCRQLGFKYGTAVPEVGPKQQAAGHRLNAHASLVYKGNYKTKQRNSLLSLTDSHVRTAHPGHVPAPR